MTQPQSEEKIKTSGGRKFLAGLGIFFVVIGVFLAAFGFSFRIMMLPEKNENEMNELERLQLEVDGLELENRRLKEENEILKDSRESMTASASSDEDDYDDDDLY